MGDVEVKRHHATHRLPCGVEPVRVHFVFFADGLQQSDGHLHLVRRTPVILHSPLRILRHQHERGMRRLVSVRGKLQRTIALGQWSRHILANGTGIGHEQHERETLRSIIASRNHQVILHRLARLSIFESELFELGNRLVFKCNKRAVTVLVDFHTATMPWSSLFALLFLGASSKTYQCHRHH